MIRQRRANFYVGPNAVYGELEDLFLSVEGVGQWAAHQIARNHAAGTRSEQDLITFVRDNRRYWSQDEGLALFLLLDVLSPGWQRKVLGPEQASPVALLATSLKP